jgi:transposase-like protein
MIPPMGRQRFERKVDRTFDTKPDPVERVEVITGVGRRRRWPANVKAQIIMESLEKGARVSEVARRHGLRPQQLFGWRKQARNHVPVASFAPVVVDAGVATSPFRTTPSNEALVNLWPASRIDELMPWAYRKAAPNAVNV